MARSEAEVRRAGLTSGWVVLCLVPWATSCIPYTVGTTAQPVPEGESAPTVMWYSIPNGVELLRDSVAYAFTGMDFEARVGVSDRADVGVRIPSMTGLVATYKHRLTPSTDGQDAALAVMGGAGLVNLGNHAHFELTLLASGRQAVLTPYGGLRVAQVARLSQSAVNDSPTAGGFLGVRIGSEELGVSPEVAVYYDRSALGLRSGNVIVVPAVVVHGSKLIDLFSGRPPRRR